MATPETAPAPQLASTADRTKLMSDQLGRFIDLYKHHFDLFLKAVAGFLAVLGFIGNGISSPQASQVNRIVLAALMALAAVFGLAGSVIAKRWVRLMREKVQKLCSELEIEEPSMYSAEAIVTVMICLCVVFFIGGSCYAIAIWRGWV